MADNIEHQDKGELVANCDRLQNDEVVVTTPVESRIMSIRGKQIMIDRDLAELYLLETRVLNQAVKRNIERFPERFRFQLTKEECLRSQIATLNEGRGQHLKYMPYVFTENGVAMLSSVLRSDPDGCGDYYTNKGICLGTDKKNNNSRTPLSSSNL